MPIFLKISRSTSLWITTALQGQKGASVVRPPSSIPCPLHPNQCQLAESRGTVICRNHATLRTSRKPHRRLCTREGHAGLCGTSQPESETVRLDGKCRPDSRQS